MKKVIVSIVALIALTVGSSAFTLCPDGTYVGGDTCTLMPDGTYR